MALIRLQLAPQAYCPARKGPNESDPEHTLKGSVLRSTARLEVSYRYVKEEDDNGNKTGSKRYIYVRLGEDHYRHAFNYETNRHANPPNWMFPELQ